MKLDGYFRLMRLHKPAGILLLWYPTAWALWFANQGPPSLRLFVLFLMGTLLMRSAGCVLNDIADRHFDKHVARTKFRPLASGEVGLIEAFVLLFVLLLAALFIAIELPRHCFYLALIALLITIIYPFCKRYIDAPQFVLGLAFSMGIPMSYLASGKAYDKQLVLLCALNFMWIVAYDTLYAMADKEDDLKIGVKSTAIYFATYDQLIVSLLQILLHSLWLVWAAWVKAGPEFYGCWFIGSAVLILQQWQMRKKTPVDCFNAFYINIYYGAVMWLAVILAFYIRL